MLALAGETMGTSWSARIVGGGPGLEREIEAVLSRIVAQMSHWEPGSDLGRLNRSAPGWWQPLPRELGQVLAAALHVAQASGGAFDPAMGQLVDLWGFGPPGPRDGIPSEAEIASALAASGPAHLEIEARRLRRTAPARLDLSGIAKGFAVDAVAEMLRGCGLPDFLVEIGGELRGEGIKPDGQPWWVDFEPVPECALAPIRVALHGLSVATSGDYRRAFTAAGKNYAHTLDPRTGRPADNGIASVTVLDPSCMLADAWATALTVLGPDGMAVAERERLAAHMVLRNGAGLSEHLSPMLRSMID